MLAENVLLHVVALMTSCKMAQDDMNNLLILCWFPAEYFFALFADQQMYCCSLCFAESEDYGNTNETVSAVQWLGFPEFLY